MRHHTLFFLLILLALVLALACEKSETPDGDAPADGDVAPDGDTAPDGDAPADGDVAPDGDTAPDGDAPADGDQPNFPLEIGDQVPDFSLPAHDGSTFTLSTHRGTRVLISAFPAAQTQVCTAQTCYVSDKYQMFLDLNTLPVGLSTDTVSKLASWAEAEEYQQLLLSDRDPRGQVSEMLGIYDTTVSVTKRANIIIDENGVMVFRRVYGMGQNPDFVEVLEFLQAEKR